MSSLTILVIRHAEKPPEKPTDPDLGPGLSASGETDKHSLVIRGWQRAGAWAALFGSGKGGNDFPRPDVVYAAKPDQLPQEGLTTSRRPWETVTPLCDRLHIAPITNHGVGDESLLLNEVTQLTGVALVCWEHKRIAEAILPGLAQGQLLPRLPAKWDRSRFDVVLRFDRAQSGAPWTFHQLFPRLLSGDSDIPLGAGDD